MKNHLLVSFVCLGFMLLSFDGKQASACKCRRPIPSPHQTLKKVSAVFVGKVVEVTIRRDSQGYKKRWAKFAVSKIWKGISSKAVVVMTGFGEGDCGCPFTKGAEFLVYAYAVKDQNHLYTNVCIRTKRLAEAKNDLKVPGPGKVLS